VLKQIELRLRDEQGRVLWIKFDEATNSMSLYRQARDRFGNAKTVGSHKVLSGPLAKVYLRTTTVTADSASSPTVLLTFDLKFKGRARGNYTIEAAASDDLEHRDPFKFAGNIKVV
jgi:hypothetical protein